jgi:hypothetical protein
MGHGPSGLHRLVQADALAKSTRPSKEDALMARRSGRNLPICRAACLSSKIKRFCRRAHALDHHAVGLPVHRRTTIQISLPNPAMNIDLNNASLASTSMPPA